MKKYIFVIILLLAISYNLYAATAQIRLETGLPEHSTVPAENALPTYIKYLFIFGLSLISILALTYMIIGGVMYILAAGNSSLVAEAKDTIFQALLGVAVLLVAYLLLRTINPDLVNLRNPDLKPIQFKGTTNEEKGNEKKIGGGGETYAWTTVLFNRYCADALGKDWRDVGDQFCQPPKPQESNACCGYFPPK